MLNTSSKYSPYNVFTACCASILLENAHNLAKQHLKKKLSMTDFQYYFQKLPCFNCKKNTVSIDLGWLTAAMKEDVIAQASTIIAQDNVEPEVSVNVTCTKDEARDYLLLNFFGYSEEELANQVKAEDEQEVAEEIAELFADGCGVGVFEHEIVLLSCTDCGIDD